MDHSRDESENEVREVKVEEGNPQLPRRESQCSETSIYYDMEDEVDEQDRNEDTNELLIDQGNKTETKITLAHLQESVLSSEKEDKIEDEKQASEYSETTSISRKMEDTASDQKGCSVSTTEQSKSSDETIADSLITESDQQEQSFVSKKNIGSFQPNDQKNADNYSNFTREAYMYSVIFPALNKFGIEKSFNTLVNIVNPYNLQQGNYVFGTAPTEGYKMWNRLDLMDMPHMISVLKSCGSWHGSVMAFKHQRPKEFEMFRGKLYNIMQKYFANEEVMKTITRNFEKVIRMLNEIGRCELADKYIKSAASFGYILLSNNVKHSVIALHADFWVDNIMFNEEVCQTSKPQMFFSNFQLPMIDSPIRDLSYIIYCYGDENLFEDFDFLLHAYYASLSDSLLELGSDPDQVFPYENLKDEWRKYGMFGALMTLLEIFDETDEDFDDEKENNEKEPTPNHKLYNKRVVDVFIHYGEKFL